MMIRSPRRAAMIIAILVGALACGPSASKVASEAAPPLSGPSLDGRTLTLADYHDQVVLVDFWATWCDPCRAEVPQLVKLHARLGLKGFVVLGVSMDEEISAVAPFVKAAQIDYPIILNGGERGPKGWLVPGLPTAYLVGRDGHMITRYLGSKSIDKLAADVEAALKR